MLDARAAADPEFDLDSAIANTLWHDARRYRVSITIGDTHNDVSARAKLFKGFDESAPGTAARRRADTIYLPTLRNWGRLLCPRNHQNQSHRQCLIRLQLN